MPFKKVEEIIDCVKTHQDWFEQNSFDICFTFDGTENEYARKVFASAQGIRSIKWIGYQQRESLLSKYCEYGLIINSELETFSLPFLEAAVFGAPIIAADHDYAREVLRDIPHARLYEKHNIEAMYDAIRQIDRTAARHTNFGLIENNTWKEVCDLLIRHE